MQSVDRGVNIKELLNSKKIRKIRGGKKSTQPTSSVFSGAVSHQVAAIDAYDEKVWNSPEIETEEY